MELSMGSIKVEIKVPEMVKALNEFKSNRIMAFETLSREIKASIATTINQLLNAEMTAFLGTDEDVSNKRNGYKIRSYTFKGIGTIRIKIPQDRKAKFNSIIIPKNEVIDPRLKEDIAVLHLAGISTRAMAMISKRLLGIEVSAKTVSNSLGKVENRALEWLTRPLDEHKYWALYIDGTNFKIQRRGSTENEPSLVVLGIDENNYRSILAIEPGFKDSASCWKTVFSSLIERGLDASAVKLGIMDGLSGLESSFKEVFSNAKTQRCWVHSLRNALNKCPKRLQDSFKGLADKIMYAASKEDALKGLNNLRAAMGNDGKKSVYTLEKDFESLTVYFEFNKSLWNSLKTTNPIERINRELKRRTKSMGTLGEKTLEIVVAFVALRIESGWRQSPVGSERHGNLRSIRENSIEVTANELFSKGPEMLELCQN